MFSLSGLARGRESVVDPDVDSGMGVETRMGRGDWQHGGGGGGGGICPRDEVGRRSRGGVGGVTMRMGMTTSEISTRGSVWVETDT